MIIPNSRPSLPDIDDYVRLLKSVWKTKYISNNSLFENKLKDQVSKYLLNKNISIISSCDIGLIISIAALNLPVGSEVIIPSFTFNSTGNALLWNNLKTVFADIDPETFCIDPEDIKRKISTKTVGIIAVNTFGNPCCYQQIAEIARKHKLVFITDSAAALGSSYNGIKVGNLADIEVFSLSGTKIITSAEGGIIVSNNQEYFSRVGSIKNYGFLENYNSISKGINGKMSEFHAALGCLTMKNVQSQVKKRNKLANIYKQKLACISGIRFQKIEGDNVCNFSNFAILTQDSEGLAKYLNRRQIVTRKYYMPLHLMGYFKDNLSSLPNTMKVWKEVLCLPIFNDMTKNDVMFVCQNIKKYYKYGN